MKIVDRNTLVRMPKGTVFRPWGNSFDSEYSDGLYIYSGEILNDFEEECIERDFICYILGGSLIAQPDIDENGNPVYLLNYTKHVESRDIFEYGQDFIVYKRDEIRTMISMLTDASEQTQENKDPVMKYIKDLRSEWDD